MTNQQTPAALRLAEELEHDPGINRPSVVAELRRLYAENTALQQGYDAARMEIDGLRDRVQPQGDAEDAARYQWLADYLIGDRTDIDDAILACVSEKELSEVIDADRKKGANHD